MEERSNKTIMCSVLFLDIVEYSKRSVSGQISLKDRFNSYLSAAISDVPVEDRIILDTGDGAAINFLSDVEDALKAALSLRESILNEGPNQDQPLLVRAGINLGPVRLVRDINGQPNIVGDGINVAQRIMGFAEADQILVSRSYFDAVSRLSPQYTEMFSYQGSRTDKHVREHEVYAIGHLGEKTAELIATNLHEIKKNGLPERIATFIRNDWQNTVVRCNAAIDNLRLRFAETEPKQRALYAGVGVVSVILIGLLTFKLLTPDGEVPAPPDADQMEAVSGVQAASGVALEFASGVASAVPADTTVHPDESKVAVKDDKQVAAQSAAKKVAQEKTSAKKSADDKPDSKSAGDKAKYQDMRHDKVAEPVSHSAAVSSVASAEKNLSEAYLSLVCGEGTQVFVDGKDRGKVTSAGMTVVVQPGKHKIIVASNSGDLYTQDIDIEPGVTLPLKPDFCK